MNNLETDEETKEWLRKQPKIFIAYKVVIKRLGKYYPGYNYTHISFFPKRTNRITQGREEIFTETTKELYKPYYHLFTSRRDARKWKEPDENDVIVKCEVHKKDVTIMGIQHDYSKPKGARPDLTTIVAKAFKIIEEME